MRAMTLEQAAAGLLAAREREVPIALPGEVLIKVRACGLCGLDVDLLDRAITAVEIPVGPA